MDMTNLSEQKEIFTISDIKNKDALQEWLGNFEKNNVDFSFVDKTIVEILSRDSTF
jgi:hypothetical protein